MGADGLGEGDDVLLCAKGGHGGQPVDGKVRAVQGAVAVGKGQFPQVSVAGADGLHLETGRLPWSLGTARKQQQGVAGSGGSGRAGAWL